MLVMDRQAAASNGSAAVLLGASNMCGIVLLRYAPSDVGSTLRRAEFNSLCARAALKLGFKRDRRCSGGWRKIPLA
tara:strand:- start:44 stop:271 length:228 start_codon:yes stop_codon:yes gene_type:complete